MGDFVGMGREKRRGEKKSRIIRRGEEGEVRKAAAVGKPLVFLVDEAGGGRGDACDSGGGRKGKKAQAFRPEEKKKENSFWRSVRGGGKGRNSRILIWGGKGGKKSFITSPGRKTPVENSNLP